MASGNIFITFSDGHGQHFKSNSVQLSVPIDCTVIQLQQIIEDTQGIRVINRSACQNCYHGLLCHDKVAMENAMNFSPNKKITDYGIKNNSKVFFEFTYRG
eukprot:816748_1